MGCLGLISMLRCPESRPICLLSDSVCDFMMRSMLALYPYAAETITAGLPSTRWLTFTWVYHVTAYANSHTGSRSG